MTEYTIAAIPTVYRGRRYRSRLEARWAAFFDLVGWRHEYEPFDLGLWSPDFLIHGAQCGLLVEVKPIAAIDWDLAKRISQAARMQRRDEELVILGADIRSRWLGEKMPDGDYDFGKLAFACYSGSDQIDFCHDHQSYHGRITGCYDGGVCGGAVGISAEHICELWAKAGNEVQWGGPGR